MVYRKYLKRGFDLVGTVVLAISVAIPFAIAALLVRLKLGSPVIFRQARPGLDGRAFVMLKLRTMTDERDSDGDLLPDAERLTKFGRFLRSTSLDEIPGLWNILRGDMSLVGPRPLLSRYLERYSAEQRRRHEVKPGLTGWAQVNGRNAIDWDEKLGLDVWYVDHESLWLDLRILFLTVLAVLNRSDISASGHATAPEFMGPATSPAIDLPEIVPGGVVVIGASGHAKVVISTLRAAGEDVVAAFDDDETLWGSSILGVPVVGPVSISSTFGVPRAVIGIGSNRIRRLITSQVDLEWVTVQHPHAWVDESAKLGSGTVVMAGAVIQPDAIVGAHAIINTSASIDHDCRIGDFAHVGPGAHLSGNVAVGDSAFLGTGASVIQGCHIGADTTVGAGGVVIGDLPENVTAVGCPARIIRHEAPVRKSA